MLLTPAPQIRRWGLWGLLVVLVLTMLSTLVWLAGRYEVGQEQSRVERDAADADLQQAFDVGIGDGAEQLPLEGNKAFIHRRDDGLVGFAFLDELVDAFLDEDALKRIPVPLLLELAELAQPLLQPRFAAHDAGVLGHEIAQRALQRVR